MLSNNKLIRFYIIFIRQNDKFLLTLLLVPYYLYIKYSVCIFFKTKNLPNMESYPKKYLIKDIKDKPTPFEVWIQGTIEQTVGHDILIVSDTFGRVKVVKCESAVGGINKNSLCKGTYCCIIGKAVKTKGLPEVQATKIIDLSSQPQMKDAWESEVKEADLVLHGKLLLDM